ncbi:NUDIX domain-containing protein, partial [Mycobacterium sp. 852002-50816_SCH5313054-b]|uniref:NUDIX domain-containing protein n=1 Tax=Mycobacterium sp. 852002-50816_SCH5313054-b TaxID=1834092 RepID=UPI000A9747C3
MGHISTEHEVLAVVFQVPQVTTAPRREKPQLNVLLWQRARDPQQGAWSLPGGRLRNDEDMTTSVRRQLAEKVDLRELLQVCLLY